MEGVSYSITCHQELIKVRTKRCLLYLEVVLYQRDSSGVWIGQVAGPPRQVCAPWQADDLVFFQVSLIN